jgi:signal transduction histidine kinase
VYEAQRLNQTLRDMNASLDSFVHIVAHDLKGPATNLHRLLEVYHEEAPGPDRDYVVGMLTQEVQRLNGTVRGLLQLLHTQHGQAAPVTEPVAWTDVYAVVQAEVGELLRRQQGQLTADFRAAPSLRYPLVYLESILKNLVHNALKYRAAERSPRVQVSTRRQGEHVLLTVTDNGRGIDLTRDRERLFQPFTRLTSEGEGAGLGLHLIRALVQQRGGDLQVSSTPGEGTTFTVVFAEDPLPTPA